MNIDIKLEFCSQANENKSEESEVQDVPAKVNTSLIIKLIKTKTSSKLGLGNTGYSPLVIS